jgi:hypothetical protein
MLSLLILRKQSVCMRSKARQTFSRRLLSQYRQSRMFSPYINVRMHVFKDLAASVSARMTRPVQAGRSRRLPRLRALVLSLTLLFDACHMGKHTVTAIRSQKRAVLSPLARTRHERVIRNVREHCQIFSRQRRILSNARYT